MNIVLIVLLELGFIWHDTSDIESSLYKLQRSTFSGAFHFFWAESEGHVVHHRETIALTWWLALSLTVNRFIHSLVTLESQVVECERKSRTWQGKTARCTGSETCMQMAAIVSISMKIDHGLSVSIVRRRMMRSSPVATGNLPFASRPNCVPPWIS